MLLGKRGPTETLPEWKAETDRAREKVSEGFRQAESERVGSGSVKSASFWLLGIREFESTGSLEAHACV